MRLEQLPTPCYVIDENQLEENLKVLRGVEERTGAKILLAQKAFSCFYEYPLIGKYISGTTASGLYEAILGKEEMGKENHVFSPAYRPQDIPELKRLCDHIVFNSPAQVKKFGAQLDGRSLGLRLNPECSTQEDHAIYDPCAKGSRMGTLVSDLESVWEEDYMQCIEGFHFHTLCEQNSDDLETTIEALEAKFGLFLKSERIKWVNFGGGHHITRADYDIPRLERLIKHIQDTYQVQVYLEPGEAIALNAGYLVTKVLEKVKNEVEILILDASAACHMPDVLEMPYRPPLRDSGMPDEKAYTYRLSSNTCLAGDVIGDYSFDQAVEEGDLLVFEDMAIYSMVKNNTFNGIPLPDIAVMRDGDCKVIRTFAYSDFKCRLS